MEKNVRVQDRLNGGRRLHLKACPRCGGDVRQVRDIYGPYLQCMQCSHEVIPPGLAAPATSPRFMPNHDEIEWRIAA